MRGVSLIRAAALALLLASPLGGCGFTPVYAPHLMEDSSEKGPKEKDIAAALGTIHIMPVANREGQILTNNLIDKMYLDGAPDRPKYTLSIDLGISERALGIQQDATATRAQLTITANFRLNEATKGQEVFRGHTRVIANYNVLEAQYGTTVAQRNATERGLDEVSNDIVNRLRLYFARESKSPPVPPGVTSGGTTPGANIEAPLPSVPGNQPSGVGGNISAGGGLSPTQPATDTSP